MTKEKKKGGWGQKEEEIERKSHLKRIRLNL